MLIVSDLHFDDTPNTGYRFKIFPFLLKKIQEHDVKNLIILGDILDKKDKHSSYLINQVCQELNFLTHTQNVDITILKGNHDYVDPDEPFLKFLGYMPKITFVRYPEEIEIEDKLCLFLPHSSQPEVDWQTVNFKQKYDMIFMHQDFVGAKVHEFYSMDKGLTEKHPIFSQKTSIYSGHIHIPQYLFDNRVMYIGSPYHINFGDTYNGRIVIPGTGSIETNLNKKHKIVIYDFDKFLNTSLDVKEHDQCKFIIKLPLSKANQYEKYCDAIKDLCVKNKISIFFTELELLSEEVYEQEREEEKVIHHSDESRIKEFGVKEKLHPDYINKALDIMKEII